MGKFKAFIRSDAQGTYRAAGGREMTRKNRTSDKIQSKLMKNLERSKADDVVCTPVEGGVEITATIPEVK